MFTKPLLVTVRVILAEYQVVVRAGIRRYLEAAGDIEVIGEAGDGRETCKIIQQLQPDIAVIDMQMPVMSGLEVVRWAQSNGIRTGFLVLTAHDDAAYVESALRAGANGYILKTAQPLEFVDMVRDVYQGKLVQDSLHSPNLIQELQREAGASPLETLHPRELEILQLSTKGFTSKAIGAQLNLSERTVENHFAHIFHKLQVNSRNAAVMRAVALKLIQIEPSGKR